MWIENLRRSHTGLMSPKRGKHLSAEIRQKISQSVIAHPSRYWLGRSFSTKHRQRLSISRKGKPLSDKHKASLKIARQKLVGIPRSDEVKKKIRESKKLRPHPLLGKHPSLETRAKMTASLTGMFAGARNPAWKGGITPINIRIRRSPAYYRWRQAILKRDDYRCFDCGVQQTKDNAVILDVDHIFPFALYPRLRFMLENGRTLCRECHKQTPTYAGRTHR